MTGNVITYRKIQTRLQNMISQTAGNRRFMDNAYSYDKESNILSIVNSSPFSPFAVVGVSPLLVLAQRTNNENSKAKK
jgi:hypothetical protein